MATGEVEIRRRPSLLTRLLTPRPVSFVALVGGGAAIGELFWRYVPWQLTVYFSGLAAPMCMAVAVAAWAMRDKVDETFSPDFLEAREYKRSREVARDVRTRSVALAGACLICAAAAGGPAFSAQLVKAFWQWMVIASGAGVGLAGYCFQISFSWEEQLRAHQEKLIARAKEAAAMKELEAKLAASRPGAPGFWGSGWSRPTEDEWAKPH